MDKEYKRSTLRFYFSFNDPYSFLISPAVKNLSQNYRVDIEMIPLTKFDNDTLFSADNATAAYYLSDVLRFSGKAGRALNFKQHSQDAKKVCLGKFLADEKMLGLKYINLVFASRWVNGKDISSTKDLLEGMKFLELGDENLEEAFETDKYQDQLDGQNALAEADGVIGVPFFSFQGEGYLGPDRLEFLEEAIKSDPSLIIHHDASYTVIQPEELDKFLATANSLVLDVRIPKIFGSGHIPGSNCLPAKIVHRNMERLDRDWSLVIVDDGGVEASDIAFSLATQGFGKVSVLSGGIESYKGERATGLDNWQDRLLKK
jgi:2-hydroxychromene-2-carboxylate isomerase/rhodanese-related sulfurtransferase